MKFSNVLSLVSVLLPNNVAAFVPYSQQNNVHRSPTRYGTVSMSVVSKKPGVFKSGTTLSAATLLNPPSTAIVTEELDTSEKQEKEAKSYLDDGFVFGLEGSGLERPKGKVANVVVEGDNLETQPYQRAMVSATLASHLLFMAFSVSQQLDIYHGNIVATMAQSMAVVISSWVAADLGSGVLHWSVDNYGNGRTPVMGGIIAAFQGHHSAPWTITQREFCNNVHKLCIPFGIPTVALISLISGPMVTLFFAVFCSLEILSQEFHKWAHTTKSEVPSVVNWLQKYGVIIGRKPHAMHHAAPYKDNYCIVSGFCNNILDDSGFFRLLERAVYKINGVESNAWKIDPNLRERALSGVYSPVKTRR